MIKKIILVLVAILVMSVGYTRDLNDKTHTATQSLYKPADNPLRSILNIGNWAYWQRDNGESAYTPSGASGGIYPRGTAPAIFLDGIVIGGYQNDLLKVSGQTHHNGTEPGYIKDGVHVTKADDPRIRMYRIRKDWETLTADQVRQDAKELNELFLLGEVTTGQIDAIIDQYKKDWEEWPTELGAPFYDLNDNGIYEPDLDETPGMANADQMLWYVITDANRNTTSTGFYGTDPIGVEIQISLWAYNQPGGALGQLLFKQLRFINKGEGDLTEAYISVFSDPDLGDYADDLINMDVDKSLMYVYNGATRDGQYDEFGLAPPAVGYDFFAGPIVESPGDVAIFNLKPKPGYKNLPASSFGYYGDADNDDPGPQGDVEAAREYYNLMRGFRPFDDLDNPTAWFNDEEEETKFPYLGDPVTGIGPLDSSPGDRRMLMNSGPFTLAEGDTQDIVVSVVGGIGDNNLASITALRNNDVVAQILFDDLFRSIPSSPPQPNVKVITMDDYLTLDWGSVAANIKNIEESAAAGYEFQGYNVWQLPASNSSLDQAVRIATFDKIDGVKTIYGPKFISAYGETLNGVPIQYGTDSGIQRSINITKNHLTGSPLLVGSTYYFGVTAFNHNPEPDLIADTSLESGLLPIGVTLAAPPLDTEYGAHPGDAITVTHSEGPSDGQAIVEVIDPTVVTGDDYEVYFDTDHYYLDYDGIWKSTAEPDAIAKLLDISPSTVTGSAVVAPPGVALNFEVHVATTDYDCAQGALIEIPGAVITSATNADGIASAIQPDGASVLFGDITPDGLGGLCGTHILTINVDAASVTFPLMYNFTLYDDNWATLTCDPDGDGIVDAADVDYCATYELGPGYSVSANAEGTGIIDELGFDFKSFFVWKVRNITTDQVVVSGQTAQSGYAPENVVDGVLIPAHAVGPNENPRAEGLSFKVNGPELGVKAVYETDVSDNILDANVGVYPASLGTTGYILSHRGHTGAAGRDHDRFDLWNLDDVIINFGETSLAWDYSTEAVNGEVPYSIYRVKFPSGEHVRLFAGYWETDGIDGWSVSDYWSDYGKDSYEPIYAHQGYDAAGNEISYDPANEAQYLADNDLFTSANVTWGSSTGEFNYPFVTSTLLVTYLDGSTPPWGNKIWITTNKPNLLPDKFTLTAPSNTVSDDLAKEAVKLINVFPNPYYADNALEGNRFDNFVTFTHLPQNAKIKIFSLDGKIVREYEKDTDSQYFKWDLRNHTDLPVASGVYIVHIDMEIDGQGLGEKILKVFIVQPNQVIKYY